MDKRFCIFDMDGTLVDSMGYWRGLGREYLRAKGASGPELERVLQQIRTMTMPQSTRLIQQTFGLTDSPEDIMEEMARIMKGHYQNDVCLKPGITAYLEKLKKRGCRMCVATATHEPLSGLCLRRLGLEPYFEFLISCEKIGVGKTSPDIYLWAAERLGCRPEQTAVFEDVLYAAQTASRAGFYTVVVQDPWAAHEWEELTALADEVVYSWESAK